MTPAIRDYWDSGRGLVLLRHATWSYGIAAVEWLLLPPNLSWIFPSLRNSSSASGSFSVFESLYPWLLGLLPLVWLVVVIKGIKKSGWFGIVLVIPGWWGMFWWIRWVLLLFSCFTTNPDCI
jgi:hypothetical protein